MTWETPADILALTDGELLNWWFSTRCDPYFSAIPGDEVQVDGIHPNVLWPNPWAVVDAEGEWVMWGKDQAEAKAWADRLNRAVTSP